MPFHGLRHSFGTECARRGVPGMTLRQVGNMLSTEAEDPRILGEKL
jgi:hypothetical protein